MSNVLYYVYEALVNFAGPITLNISASA